SEKVGWVAALAYPIMCSIFTYYGVSPNTELFFNTFTAAAICLTIPPLFDSPERQLKVWTYTGAGLLLGAAVLIKPVAAAEALAIGLFLLIWGFREKRLSEAILRACTPMTIAFAIPLFFCCGYYAQMEMLDAVHFYNWELTKRYPVELKWYLRIKYLGDYALRYSPLVLLAGFAVYEVQKKDRNWQQFLLLQIALVALVIVLPGKRFGHYQIQLHPALASLAATWWLPTRIGQAWLRRLSFRTGFLVCLGFALLMGCLQFFAFQKKHDQAAEVANWLNDRLEADEEVFMLNFHQIVYHLIDRPVPTKYVHSSLLFFEHHVRALGLDLNEEATKFVNNEKLRYVVARRKDVEEEYPEHPIVEAIIANFPEVDTFDEELLIFHR
ncbi:MAG: hypothetical protein AAFU03_12520, partial [Bacteroidota bacterium]